MKKIVLLGLSLLFSLGVVAQETKAKTTKKAATEKAEKAKKAAKEEKDAATAKAKKTEKR